MGGVELHILLAGYVTTDQWEDSTETDPYETIMASCPTTLTPHSTLFTLIPVL